MTTIDNLRKDTLKNEIDSKNEDEIKIAQSDIYDRCM